MAILTTYLQREFARKCPPGGMCSPEVRLLRPELAAVEGVPGSPYETTSIFVWCPRNPGGTGVSAPVHDIIAGTSESAAVIGRRSLLADMHVNTGGKILHAIHSAPAASGRAWHERQSKPRRRCPITRVSCCSRRGNRKTIF